MAQELAGGHRGAASARAAVAAAFGHVTAESIAPALALIDRELAMLWRLQHSR